MSRIHQSFFFLYLNKYYRKFQFLIYNFQAYGLYIFMITQNRGIFWHQQVVSWSSWLWHMLNTHNVPSSILGEIISSFLWFRGLVGYGICLTRITSPVRSWAESFFFLGWKTKRGNHLDCTYQLKFALSFNGDTK